MRIGVFQCEAGAKAPEDLLEEMEQCCVSLDLLICPELFLSGYRPEAVAAAEPQDGPFGQAVAALAARMQTAIAYGYPERAGEQIYNSAALYSAEGLLIANHRKRLPSPGSFEEDAFVRGTEPTFADLNGWRVAIVICYEVEFPESLRAAAMGGAELVIVPTALGADWGVVAEHVVPARAYENGIWVAYADQAGAADGLRFYGGSRIVGPDGHVKAKADGKAALVTAETDRESVTRMQARLPFLMDHKALL